jgi:hypothetical protein
LFSFASSPGVSRCSIAKIARRHQSARDQKSAKTGINQAILNVPNDNQRQLLIWRPIEPPQNTMSPQRTIMRASQRLASQLRSPAVRTPFQRRFASSESTVFKGAEDNAFNRERLAVKEHAAGTTGEELIEPLRVCRS